MIRKLSFILVAAAAAVGCDGPEGSGQAFPQDAPAPTTQEAKERDFQQAIFKISHGSAGERSLAAAELGNSSDSRAIEPLAGVIGFNDANVRYAVILALSDLADSLGGKALAPALEAVKAATSDPNEGVRLEAANLLKKIPSP